MPDKEEPCKRLACAIQTCIQRNQFQQERCNSVVRDLHRCCADFYERHEVVDAKLRALD
ncbi:hypothetical protein MOBT1_001896 [Malassezia obtusa]|uniref:Cx9C motif-containing protein 4, mitochondrial n=1 Tax=Malassezia obtusa TaxID=76774 RepID=A0AAF0E468_9BASI|nr:hypothetical protein MOBT1_001896 [Malassezia obtusa]